MEKFRLENLLIRKMKKMIAKISYDLLRLADKGNTLRMPYSEYLKDGIFQLRTQLGNNISRVLYFFYCGNDIIITNGFIKKTEETPPKEIEKAKKYRTDYIERRNTDVHS